MPGSTSATSATATLIICQFDPGYARARSVLPVAWQALFSGQLGHLRIRLAAWIHHMGRAGKPRRRQQLQRLWRHRRLGCPLRCSRLAAVSPRRLPARPSRTQRSLREVRMGAIRLLRRVPPRRPVVRLRRARHRPRHRRPDGREPSHWLCMGDLCAEPRSPHRHAESGLSQNLMAGWGATVGGRSVFESRAQVDGVVGLIAQGRVECGVQGGGVCGVEFEVVLQRVG